VNGYGDQEWVRTNWYMAVNSTDPNFWSHEAVDLPTVLRGHRLCAGPSFTTGEDEELRFAVDTRGGWA
jgi:hypothetical protein